MESGFVAMVRGGDGPNRLWRPSCCNKHDKEALEPFEKGQSPFCPGSGEGWENFMEKLLILQESYRKRGLEDIAEADLLASSHFYLGAVSRSYYACLHAMHYLLAQKGIQTKTHKQTHTEFRKHFVKEGIFGKEESMLISDLFRLRQNCDYDPMFEITPSALKELLGRAKGFVEEVCKK